jgi:3',5'-cyclic AMP phosphodiesterase CpdA
LETFRFIHISDLHLASESRRLNCFEEFSLCHPFNGKRCFFAPSSYDVDIAEQVSRFIFEFANMKAEGLDFVVVTGDLATTGKEEDLKKAHDFIYAPPSSGSPWLTADGFPTLGGSYSLPPFLVMPGNHDRFVDEYLFPGGKAFDKVFSSYWPGGNLASYKISKTNGAESLFLVLCDFTLEALNDADPFLGYLGQGRVYDSRLDDLVAATKEIGAPNIQNIIWGMHFTPAYTGKYSLQLQDHDKLLQAANKLNVNLVLSGHIHKAFSITNNSVEIHATGSATVFTTRDENILTYYEVDVLNNKINALRRTDYQWNRLAKDFLALDLYQTKSSNKTS